MADHCGIRPGGRTMKRDNGVALSNWIDIAEMNRVDIYDADGRIVEDKVMEWAYHQLLIMDEECGGIAPTEGVTQEMIDMALSYED